MAKKTDKPVEKVEKPVEKVDKPVPEIRLQGFVLTQQEKDVILNRLMDSIPTKMTTRENCNLVAFLSQLPVVTYIKP